MRVLDRGALVKGIDLRIGQELAIDAFQPVQFSIQTGLERVPVKGARLDVPAKALRLVHQLGVARGKNHQLFRHAAPDHACPAIAVLFGEGDFGPVFARRNTRRAHAAGTATNDKKVVIKIAHLGRGLSLLIAQVGEQVIRLDKLHLIAINSAFVDVAHFDAAIAIADHHGITDINE